MLRYIDVLHHLLSEALLLGDCKPSSRMVAFLSGLSHQLRKMSGSNKSYSSWWVQFAPAGSRSTTSLSVPYEPAEFRFRHYYACRIVEAQLMRRARVERERTITVEPTGRVLSMFDAFKAAKRHRKICSFSELHTMYWQQVCLRIEAESRLRELELAGVGVGSGPNSLQSSFCATPTASRRAKSLDLRAARPSTDVAEALDRVHPRSDAACHPDHPEAERRSPVTLTFTAPRAAYISWQPLEVAEFVRTESRPHHVADLSIDDLVTPRRILADCPRIANGMLTGTLRKLDAGQDAVFVV
jgi:hypothetical protein